MTPLHGIACFYSRGQKNVAFSSLKSHTLHSRNPIQHQKQIQQAYAEKYCWIKLFGDDAAHMLSEMGNCTICRKEYDFYCIRGSSKKKNGIFWEFFPNGGPPTPPFWEPLSRKKILGFILHFRP